MVVLKVVKVELFRRIYILYLGVNRVCECFYLYSMIGDIKNYVFIWEICREYGCS